MRNNRKSKIANGITFVILMIILYFAYQFYQSNNFYDYVKSESKLYTAQFKRDKEIKYSKSRSYKIETDEYEDAMFSKKIEVKKNTPYRVTCMVKTRGIQTEEQKSGIGAQISIIGTTERSIALAGTNEWQKLELIFNSKNRESIDIGFRLGGSLGNAKGEVWFSDMKIEEGSTDQSDEWKFACFIFENTSVNIDGKKVELSVTQSDITDITNTIGLFEKACSELSQRKMTAKCDIYQVKEPITTLSYDNEFAYYVAPEDVEKQIKGTIENGNYNHIFVIIKLGDEQHKDDIQINDWIGLGSMDYYGIGYSNIRLPNDEKSYIYKYNSRINTFPEEVFLHEFLHSLERTATEYGYNIPALHDYEKYGYKNEKIIGQKTWYKDYMNSNIASELGRIGLPEEVYKLKPAKNSDFEYSYQLKEFKEPENIIEEIIQLFNNLANKIKMII